MLKLYNTLSKKKEIFKPIGDEVGVYSCGPTVYWYQHIGNLRSYVFADVLKRVLMYDGFKVKHIINVTDVGHLTSDADEGEDKLEKAAIKEGKSATEISHFYFNVFRKDFGKLNLIEPTKWVWATEHIREQIDLISILEKRGFIYETSDGIYFDSSKVADYGKLARLKIENLEEGKRVEVREKRNKTDFALWKFSKPEDKRQQEWESPWGIGFPGWHIECSAMASKYLGKQFDIHTGGEDHIGVHHTNEIAQSESAWGKKPWVKYWMHGAFLNFKGGKMSKSSGEIKTISELEKDGIGALAYKYFCYTAHYRKPLTWSDEAILSAVSSFKKLKNIVLSLEDDREVNKKYLKEFETRIDDDLDMPGAVAVLWSMLRDEKINGKVGAVKRMDEIFGLRLLERDGKLIQIPKEIAMSEEKVYNLIGDRTASWAIVQRVNAKAEANWKEADELRNKIKKRGWKIKDVGDGFELEKI